MNLYRISQSVNNGYDTYDSAVVAAESEEAARSTYPCHYADPYGVGFIIVNGEWHRKLEDGRTYRSGLEWAPLADVQVQYLGVAAPDIQPGVIVASFNAG